MHVIRKTTDLCTHTPFNLVVNVVHKTDDDDGMVNMLVCLFVGGCASSCVFVCVYVGGGLLITFLEGFCYTTMTA